MIKLAKEQWDDVGILVALQKHYFMAAPDWPNPAPGVVEFYDRRYKAMSFLKQVSSERQWMFFSRYGVLPVVDSAGGFWAITARLAVAHEIPKTKGVWRWYCVRCDAVPEPDSIAAIKLGLESNVLGVIEKANKIRGGDPVVFAFLKGDYLSNTDKFRRLYHQVW